MSKRPLATLPGYRINDMTAVATVGDVARFLRGLPAEATTRGAVATALHGILVRQGYDAVRNYRLVPGRTTAQHQCSDIQVGAVAVLVDSWQDDELQFSTTEVGRWTEAWAANDLVREILLLTQNPTRSRLGRATGGKPLAIALAPGLHKVDA